MPLNCPPFGGPMKDFLLTLGHNSSLCMVEDGNVEWGYETERLTGVKSDSSFPAGLVAAHVPGAGSTVYVTHWSPTGDVHAMKPKHWRPDLLPEGTRLIGLSADFTHHDAHMWGAMCYAGPNFNYRAPTIGLVVDGFGNFGEHFSVYRIQGPRSA